MYRIGRGRLYITLIITLLLESTFLNLVSIGNIRPNLILILVIFIGLHSDWRESLEAGMVGGLLRGIASTDPIGMNLIILGLCGLFASYCKNKVYKENFLTQIILTLLMAAALNVCSLFTNIVIKNLELAGVNLMFTSIKTIVLLSLYTSLFSPPAFIFLKKLLRVKESKI